MTGLYYSDGPTPSLADCLKATQWRIQRQYRTRAEHRSGVSFEEFWNGICDWLGSKDQKRNASKLEALIEIPPLDEPEAFGSLSLAVAYWIEAAVAHDHLRDDARSWAALLRCHYYFGMASGPATATERSSKGGETQAGAFKPLRSKVLEWLSEFQESSFPSVAEVIKDLKPKVDSFRPDLAETAAFLSPVSHRKKGHGRSTNFAKLIRDWTRTDEDVRAAVERVVEGGIRRGRKKTVAPKRHEL
ncbi:hypothetical protein ACFWZU_07890 [Frateuria sp. GZRR33]|uniref:hypothetical protein n=1 Tax=Frateuria sp. GZRR33 TaxID=3351535 RepID=UPI003EDC4230